MTNSPAAGHQLFHVDYDVELRKHNEVLRQSYGIRSNDHVLDIGCGTGRTTREAARLAASGRVFGVDISASMIERARRLSEAAGVQNVDFEQGDAEVHRFPEEYFDVAISRFGTMFFTNPTVAFSNIARSMRRGGRLVMMVWQDQSRNEWAVSIRRALTGASDLPTAPPDAAGAFSLADPVTTQRILESAGLAEVELVDVHEPVHYGPDVAAAFEWVSGFSTVTAVLQQLDPASTERARERMRLMLAAHCGENGVWLDSRAWLVIARRR